jgi:hypothetical protein
MIETKFTMPQVIKDRAIDYKLLYYVSEGGVYNGAS